MRCLERLRYALRAAKVREVYVEGGWVESKCLSVSLQSVSIYSVLWDGNRWIWESVSSRHRRIACSSANKVSDKGSVKDEARGGCLDGNVRMATLPDC